MSSYDGRRPGGYAPGLEISCRKDAEGGEVRDPAELRWPNNLPLPRTRCVLLVHGFNNHEGEAARAYLGFRDRQYDGFEDLVRPCLEQRFADAFWPGDARWPGPLDWLDFMVYPTAVPVARDGGRMLADAVRGIAGLVTLDVIAHSLGCRLALAAIGHLRAHGGPAIGRVCLMAGAVPVETLESAGDYADLLRALMADGVRVHVMHSTGDIVCRFAFPPGQALADEPSRAALGYAGPPPGMPGLGANVTETRVLEAGHADYWGHKDNDASQRASREAGEFLQIGAKPREVGAIRRV